MRVLLDECLPKKLKKAIRGHSVSTVVEMGWIGKKNGELLRLAASKFEVFITVDQNLGFQQNLGHSTIPIILLRVKDNRLESFLPLLPKIHQALDKPPSKLIRLEI